VRQTSLHLLHEWTARHDLFRDCANAFNQHRHR